MAMTNVQMNVISEIQKIAAELISIQGRLTSISAMYTNENLFLLTDADFAAVAAFQHIQAAEFQAAGAALVAVNNALGSGSNSNWAKLLKIVDSVPR